MNIITADPVVVLSGQVRGMPGKVIIADPKNDKVIVEGVNVASCHVRPRKQDEQGGIIKKETPIYVSKVMLVCPKCNKPTRIAYKVNGKEKSRVCKKCGAEI